MQLRHLLSLILVVPALSLAPAAYAAGKKEKPKKAEVKKDAPKKKEEPKKEEPKKEEAKKEEPKKDEAKKAGTCVEVPAGAPEKEKNCKTEGNTQYADCMKDSPDEVLCKSICDGYVEECMK